MPTRPVKIFNAFDLQFGSNTSDHLHIQETLEYCETHFQFILSVFGHAGHATQQVIQRGLHKELVCDCIEIISNIPSIIPNTCRHSCYPMLAWWLRSAKSWIFQL